MGQLILVGVFTAFLALSPEYSSLPARRRERRGKRTDEVEGAPPVVYAAPRRVLIIDRPFEPTYAYIRVDDAVYPLLLRGDEFPPHLQGKC